MEHLHDIMALQINNLFGCSNSFTQFGCLLVDAEDLAVLNAKCGTVSLLVGFY